MKIAETEIVLRVLVKFSRKETAYLRSIGYVHPLCAEETELHMTLDHFEQLYQYPCFNKEELDRVLRKAVAEMPDVTLDVLRKLQDSVRGSTRLSVEEVRHLVRDPKTRITFAPTTATDALASYVLRVTEALGELLGIQAFLVTDESHVTSLLGIGRTREENLAFYELLSQKLGIPLDPNNQDDRVIVKIALRLWEKDRPKRQRRKLGPAIAGHPSVGEICQACRQPIEAGDYTTLVPLGPGPNIESQERARNGQSYNAVAIVVHWACATGGGLT